MSFPGPDSPWRRAPVLLVAGPFLLAALVGLGAASPLGFELLGAATLALLAGLATARLRQAAPPGPVELVLALGAGEGLALAVLVGGRWATHPGLAALGRWGAAAGAALAGLLLLLLVLPRRLGGPTPDATGADPAPPGGDRRLLLLTAAPVAAGLFGLGARWPGASELLGGAVLGLLAFAGWRRARRQPAPRPGEVLLGLVGAQALALSVLAGGRVALLHPSAEPVCRRLSAVAALAAAACLGLLGALPALSRWWGPGVEGTPPASPLPEGRRGRRAVLAAWALAHLPVLALLPPLVQFDSWTNVLEPDLFVPASEPFHHPPVYVELVKAACQAPTLGAGLTAVVLLQHLLVLGLALLVEDVLRRVSGDALVAVVVGCATAVEGSLLLYAQLIMSEVLAATLLVAAFACLARAEQAGRAGPWVLGAGACAAFATLTRQVIQLWWLLGLAWVAGLAGLRGRARACAVLLAGALLPVLLVVAHHHVFLGRAIFTAASGRSLIARITPGMPDLTDPEASPDDELERARRILWRLREPQGWYPIHAALKAELGWTDEQIAAAIPRFYLEQVRRHPLPFAAVTLEGYWAILRGSERWEVVTAFHDRVIPQAPPRWRDLPQVGSPPRWLGLLDLLAWTHLGPVLLLAALAPLLAQGRARGLALLALLSAAYLIAIPALFEQPLPRYRLPACPLIALASGLALAGARARLRPGASSSSQAAACPA